MPKLTLVDGTTELPEGEPVGSVLPPEAIAARVDGRLVDLSFVPSGDAEAEPVLPNDPDGLHVLRHSAAHVMAQAVCDLFPGPRTRSGRRSRTASTTTSSCPVRSPRPTCRRSRTGCASSWTPTSRSSARSSRARRRSSDSPTSRTSARSSRPSRRARSRRRHGHRLPQRRLVRSLPRSARPVDRPARRVQAHEARRRVLARRREPPDAPRGSTAPHGRRRTISTPTCSASRRPRSATTAGSAASSTCSRAPTSSAPACGSGTPRAGLSASSSRTTCARSTSPRGYDLVVTPHIARSVLWETSGHLDKYGANMYPPMQTRAAITTRSR